MSDEDLGDLWVRTSPTLDGTSYMGVLEMGDDRSIPLDEELAHRLAEHIREACVRAEFDAKVFRQMSDFLGMDKKQTAETVLELREKRSFMDVEGLPFVLVPGVNSAGKPFLVVQIDNEAKGQLDLTPAYGLATHIASVNSWARRDEEYLKYLTKVIGVDESTARNTIEALRNA